MADQITLTASIRSNLLSLQNTAKLLNLTSERLSTGKKVNSALDNPSAFFAARGLSNRALDLTTLKDGMAQAINTLKTADKALTSITNLVDQAKSLANQAKEASAAIGAVSKIEGVATAGTSGGSATVATSITAAFGAAVATQKISISVTNGGALTITVGASDTIQDVLDSISAADTGVEATFNTGTQKIEIAATAGSVVAITSAAPLIVATVADVTFGTDSTAEVESYASDYDKVVTQINEMITNGDSGYKGINLLKDTTTLDVKLSENTSQLSITGVDASSTGLGINATASWTTVAGSVDSDITLIEGAITKLRSYAGSFGTDLGILQYRQDYTSELVNTLQDGAGQLTNANLEEEAANMLALQTRQSLGTQALSISNQSQQSILSLFR